MSRNLNHAETFVANLRELTRKRTKQSIALAGQEVSQSAATLERGVQKLEKVSKIRKKIISKFCKFCKFLAGSFSAVSKRNFARKYVFDSIFQALQDLHPFVPLQSQNFSKKSV